MLRFPLKTNCVDHQGWLSKKEDGPYNINYKADSNQLSFLQLLSGRSESEIWSESEI